MAVVTVSVSYGLGNHLAIVKAAGTLTPMGLWEWVANALIGVGTGVGKFAVVTFYTALQGPTYKWRQRFLYFLATTNVS